MVKCKYCEDNPAHLDKHVQPPWVDALFTDRKQFTRRFNLPFPPPYLYRIAGYLPYIGGDNLDEVAVSNIEILEFKLNDQVYKFNLGGYCVLAEATYQEVLPTTRRVRK